MENSKVKINFKTGEVEFEGTEAFVGTQMENLEKIIEIMSQFSSSPTREDMSNDDDTDNTESTLEQSVADDDVIMDPPGTFGEWLHKFRKDINDLDKALITAYFIQKQSPDNDFKTKQISDTLKDQGIKLANPSSSLKRLSSKKYMFQTRKVGSLRYQRVSADGLEYLKSLFR